MMFHVFHVFGFVSSVCFFLFHPFLFFCCWFTKPRLVRHLEALKGPPEGFGVAESWGFMVWR